MKRRPVQSADDGDPSDWPGSALVSAFLQRQRAGRRLAPRTCLTYGRSLKGFARWMQANGGWDGDWAKLTARHLRDFVIERQNTHDRRSVHNQVSALRSFLADLRERGGITLLGDAAHPMLPWFGQGAASAIEDAVVLGRCLLDSGTTAELGAAFARYERSRKARVGMLQRESAASQIKSPTRWKPNN